MKDSKHKNSFQCLPVEDDMTRVFHSPQIFGMPDAQAANLGRLYDETETITQFSTVSVCLLYAPFLDVVFDDAGEIQFGLLR